MNNKNPRFFDFSSRLLINIQFPIVKIISQPLNNKVTKK